uniref:Putative secreted protein n=1 Tax=Anopheles marajoara TaxID=58244 RepID=A0A2M4C6N2_9DIPT
MHACLFCSLLFRSRCMVPRFLFIVGLDSKREIVSFFTQTKSLRGFTKFTSNTFSVPAQWCTIISQFSILSSLIRDTPINLCSQPWSHPLLLIMFFYSSYVLALALPLPADMILNGQEFPKNHISYSRPNSAPLHHSTALPGHID